MSSQFNPNTLQVIDRLDAQKFYDSLSSAFSRMSSAQLWDIYFFLERRNAIAVSFDKDWQPFIGYTAGYNDMDNRMYLKGGGQIFKLIRMNLQNLHQSLPDEPRGGRIFIKRDRIYRSIGETEIVFFKCIWLGDNDKEINPVANALQLLSTYRKGNHLVR